jgi:uridine kinase
MQNIIPIIDLINKIYQARPPREMATKIIAIDGCGGSGKSTFAIQLSKHLRNCPIIHTDDFASWDNPLNWYPRLIEQVLIPLSLNKVANYQKFDWNEKKLSEWLIVHAQEFVILEGVSSSRKEFRPFLSYSIFVETSREIRLKRGLERDGQPCLDQWLEWMIEEDNYIAKDDPKNYVNTIIDGESDDKNYIVIFK